MIHRVLPRLCAVLFLSILACAARAGSVNVSLGTGPGGFDSRGLDLSFDVGAMPLSINAGYFQSVSDGEVSMEQSNAGLDWQVSSGVSLQLGASRIDDDIFIMKGADLGLGLQINPYWGSKLKTMLNFGLGRMDYTPDTARQLPQALLDHLPDQDKYSIGLVQGLTENLTLNLSFDSYDYTEDPKDLARAIAVAFLKRGRYPPNAAFTLVAFPDKTYSIGLGWELGSDLGLDFGFSHTETVLGQKLRNVSVGVTHYGETLTMGMSISRSFSTEVNAVRRDVTIIPSSDDIYVDFRVGMHF
jgi:hypothetical protein